MADYTDKIRKLLALSESPNEAEARAALLKAKELMAEHKLTEADIERAKAEKVVQIRTGITFSARRDPWIDDLSGVIGDNYCCRACRTHWKGKQTREIGFAGFESDVKVCEEVFRYAVDTARAGIADFKAGMKDVWPPVSAREISRMSASFGKGFVRGLAAAYDEQGASHQEWGLVMVIPKEVNDFADSRWRTAHFSSQLDSEANDAFLYAKGYDEGKRFDPSTKLKEA